MKFLAVEGLLMSCALIITRDEVMRGAIQGAMGAEHRVLTGKDAETAMTVLEVWPVDLVLLDCSCELGNFAEIIDYCGSRFPTLSVVTLGASNSPDLDASAHGIQDISLPCTHAALRTAMGNATALHEQKTVSKFVMHELQSKAA